MPKRLAIVGTLYILAGLAAIWSIISQLMNSHVNFNLAILMLPVGIGLLNGKASSRGFAIFWVVLGYIGCALVALFGFFFPEDLTFTSGGEIIYGKDALPPTLAYVTAFTTLLLIIQLILRSPKVVAYCQGTRGTELPQDRQPLPKLARRHLVTSILVCISIPSVAYFLINPPQQSDSGYLHDVIESMDEIVHNIQSDEQHKLKIEIIDGFTSKGSKGGSKVQKRFFIKQGTPKELENFITLLNHRLNRELGQNHCEIDSQRFRANPAGCIDFTIHYTRGSRQGTIETSTSSESSYPFVVSIKAEEHSQ
ncbi:hypothetical protein Rhal01_02163 [Rubritalea halochordaticola]|uniref:Uncharacterized protein n=1 Tax=Rubritalea halochordaticola TaxID=714537 RepID=A0ABP9V5T6_9BACT